MKWMPGRNAIFGLLLAFSSYFFYQGLIARYGKPGKPKLKRYFAINDDFSSSSVVKVGDTLYHQVPDFSFIDQNNEEITEKTLAGKIFITDFFFTRCPTICPVLTRQLVRVMNEFRTEPKLHILSHSIDPINDSVPVLKRFAERYEVNWPNWHFLTGDTATIKSIAKKGYFVTAIPGDGAEMTDHSGKFILVDKDRVIRGYYNGTDSAEVNKMMYDIKVLLLEDMKYESLPKFQYKPQSEKK